MTCVLSGLSFSQVGAYQHTFNIYPTEFILKLLRYDYILYVISQNWDAIEHWLKPEQNDWTYEFLIFIF